MTTLKLDASGTNLQITDNKLVIISGEDKILQSIKTRIQTIRGEYFLDLDDGVPYLDVLGTKPADITLLRQILNEVIRETPGVTDVGEIDIRVNTQTRVATVEAVVFIDPSLPPVIFAPIDIELR